MVPAEYSDVRTFWVMMDSWTTALKYAPEPTLVVPGFNGVRGGFAVTLDEAENAAE